MQQVYSGGEVLFVATQIERNGGTAYRKLAERHPGHAAMLNEMAADEDQHYNTFLAMQQASGAPFHDDDDALTYLNRVAGAFVFEEGADPLVPFAGCRTAAEILDVAISLERKSIELYQAMLGAISREADAALVRAIVAEEEDHVAKLTKAKASL